MAVTHLRDRTLDTPELRGSLAGQEIHEQARAELLGIALGVAADALTAPRQDDADDELT
jgi:hypothetical protein